MLRVILTNGLKKWVDLNTAKDLQQRNKIVYVIDEQEDISSINQTDEIIRWYRE